MATAITLYKTADGKTFTDENEAAAHDVMLTRQVEIDAFVDKHFPSKEGAKKKNPHKKTASKAIALWIANH